LNADIKLCECGCGQPAPIATSSHAKRGLVRGQPKRFISGHNAFKHDPIDESVIPPKYCECGCGGITSIATENDASRGMVRGQRLRFMPCHHSHRTIEEAFLENAIPGEPGQCWEWRGSMQSNGYGVVKYRHKQVYAHRMSYERAHGFIPDGLCVCHTCDNRKCWNPEHLFLGTNGDNAADKVGAAKLTDTVVAQIKQELATLYETYDMFALRYGVNRRAIAKIASGEYWKHIPGPSPEEMMRFHTRGLAGQRPKRKRTICRGTGTVVG
jgi:hypothetical protein